MGTQAVVMGHGEFDGLNTIEIDLVDLSVQTGPAKGFLSNIIDQARHQVSHEVYGYNVMHFPRFVESPAEIFIHQGVDNSPTAPFRPGYHIRELVLPANMRHFEYVDVDIRKLSKHGVHQLITTRPRRSGNDIDRSRFRFLGFFCFFPRYRNTSQFSNNSPQRHSLRRVKTAMATGEYTEVFIVFSSFMLPGVVVLTPET